MGASEIIREIIREIDSLDKIEFAYVEGGSDSILIENPTFTKKTDYLHLSGNFVDLEGEIEESKIRSDVWIPYDSITFVQRLNLNELKIFVKSL